MRGVRGAGYEVDVIDVIEDGLNPVVAERSAGHTATAHRRL